ncbi:galactokinase [Amycolatopsis alkalitolerans]|uniref:Galactokinase n=1 Tax=Amycolatopsis alkalitolerans TaxID=2547244 RepID=A0A5C4M7J1_9PSEU|nr:galactokinase [Amycolatopsis alkalitolerans]TNC28945.1 galactokinase [Amycolatopsis alkalitolerans]
MNERQSQAGADRSARFQAHEAAARAFRSVHGRHPEGVWSAPGRVNLIGEHTDYNDGFVLPFALPHRIAAAASPREDQVLTVATLGSDGRIQQADPVEIPPLEPGAVHGWAAYPAGVAWVLRDHGADRGADIVLAGDVPTGAGLSSSHALECAVSLALLGLHGQELDRPGTPDRMQIARWVQRAENDFVGAPTGLLDQTASLCCTESHVLFLDVRSGETEQVPFDTAAVGLRIVVIDTRTKHSHSESGYGDRRRGTERAADLLGVKALRDVPLTGLDAALGRLPSDLAPLVRHVVTENQRVLDVVDLLHAGRIEDIGPFLDASHSSMRDDYRISTVELDTAVEAARAAGALGARMTGGGFGGSAIALVPESKVGAVEAGVTAAYEREGWRSPRTFVAVPSAGAGRDR